nr:hypothetical protein [Tanacetum cinerariifolium]
MDTKFEKSSVIRQPNAFKRQRPSVLGKPTTFSNSFVRKDYSKSQSVTQNNVSNDFSKPVTAQTLPPNKESILKNTNVLAPGMYKLHTDHNQARTSQLPQDSRKTNKHVSFSTRVIPKTGVSRPQLKSNPMGDIIMRNNSQEKKHEVEDQRRNVKLPKNKTFVTACNDSLNAKTLNVNSISDMCDKCVLIDKHDMCVLNSIAKPIKRTFTPSGYKWKPKSGKENVNLNLVEIVLFIVDSGYSKHMTGNLKLLINFVEKFLGTIKFGNEQIAPILGYGDLVQGAITIKRVYYVEGLNHNLFSVGQFCNADLEVAFRKSTCFICDLKGNDLLTGSHDTDLYSITLQDTNCPNPICLMAKALSSQAWLWHRLLYHLNFDTINLLSKNDIVVGFPKLKFVKDHLCSSCELRKAKQKSFHTKNTPCSKRQLQLLYIDLCGPMRVASINGKRYVLVIVDDYSRYTWTYFLRPQLKSIPQGDRVLRNSSQGKKQEVEDQRRSVKLSKNKTYVTACNDSLNAKTLNVNSLVEIVLFIVDSGCSKHMTGNLKLLINLVEKFLGTVKFGNDQITPILGYGDLVQGTVMIKRVYYVEGLNHNLFSVGQLCDADLEVAFRKSTCFIRDLKRHDLLTGSRGTDLYSITLQDTNYPNPIYLMAKASSSQAWLWHRRLSHLNFDTINLLSKNDNVVGLPKLKFVKDHLCSSCELGKAKRKSFHTKLTPSSKGRDGENLDKIKEKGDECIFVGYSTQSRAYRVFNKRTRVIMESIHVNFNELPQMASDLISSDPAPECQTMALEHASLSPAIQRQANVPQADRIVTTSNELDLLFSLMFDELLNGSSKNINQAETYAENDQVTNDEFINIFCTPVQDQGKTSSRQVDSSNLHTFYQRYPSEHRWTKDHPLEQVIGNPSQSVRTRRQLELDAEICMFALTVSRTEPKNIKEAMADLAWIESMQEELHQFDRLDV